MKFKQIEKLLKREQDIVIVSTPSCQFLGSSMALYPIYGLPVLTQHNIFGVLDVSDIKSESYSVREIDVENKNVNLPIDLSDSIADEILLDRGNIQFAVNGRAVEPLTSSKGLILIDTDYLRPFDDTPGYELYERTARDGSIYIAAKKGFSLLGIILPFTKPINKNFAASIREIYMQLNIAISYAERMSRNQQISIGAETDEDE